LKEFKMPGSDSKDQAVAEQGNFFDVLSENSEDNKRHFEMLSYGMRLIKDLNPTSILTLGDRFCRDGAYLKKELGCKVVASDLELSQTSEVKQRGYVDDLLTINAEKIPLLDGDFDVVFTKESYHHFERPQLGLYEMIRVARRAVVLIEPHDIHRKGQINFIEEGDFLDAFERVGNYKYQVSLREILKTAWSLRLPCVTASGFNDPYKLPFNFSRWIEEKKRLDEEGNKKNRPFNLLAICLHKTPLPAGFNPNGKVYYLPQSASI